MGAILKKVKRVAVIGGSNLRATDKWIKQVAKHLTDHKATEVITTGNGGGAEIGVKASWEIEMPNVIMKPSLMAEKADVLLTLPGGSNTRAISKLFTDKKKTVVQLVGEG